MNKYTLKQTTDIIREKIGYNISHASIALYKRLGVLKPHSIEHVPYMNRTIPVYTDESIDNFCKWYLEEVKKGNIKQFSKSVTSEK